MKNIQEFIRAESCIITSTESHARDLMVRYGLMMRDSGKAVWDMANIHSFRKWVIDSWLATWPAEQLLHPVQELTLYKSIISKSEAGEDLLSAAGIARLARRAGLLLKEYDIDLDDEGFNALPETVAFRAWHQEAELTLAEMGWITYGGMIDSFIEHVESGAYQGPAEILFSGFINFTPQQQRLIDALKANGIDVIKDQPEGSGESMQLRRYESAEDELRAVAAQIKALLEPYIDSPSQAPRIGVIVPNIDNYRGDIDQIFTEVITPNYLFPAEGGKHIPWRYTAGLPLIEHELINTAMDVLNCQLNGNDINLITRILLNRRFGNGPELQQRANIDLQLREKGGPVVSLTRVLNLLNTTGHSYAERFTSRLTCLIESIENEAVNNLPSSWANHFRKRLDCLGWPGDVGLSSSAYQALGVWDESLAVFSSMDRQMGKINRELALTLLREILYARPFQPRMPYYEPVQILTLTDAPGHYFDHAFILNLTGDTLPQAASPNPLIPLDLQRTAGVISATPEKRLLDAEGLFLFLRQVAVNINISCPLVNSSGNTITPSPLLEDWPTEITQVTTAPGMLQTILDEGIQTQLPSSDPIPPVISVLDEGVRGGVSILQQFAEMPFIAFCTARLGLKPFPIPKLGLEKSTQGSLVHLILQQFWGEVQTSVNLNALDDDELQETVDRFLQQTTTESGLLAPWRYGERLVQLEKTRLKHLILKWLAFEKTRGDEFAVIARELRVKGNILDLDLELVIDRVDKITMADGSNRYLVIDYKTGSRVNKKGWSTTELTEPQLPIYTTINGLTNKLEEPINGVALGHVVQDKFAFHMESDFGETLNDEQRPIEDHSTQWADTQEYWRKALEENTSNFLQGVADANYADLRGSFFHDYLSVLLREEVI